MAAPVATETHELGDLIRQRRTALGMTQTAPYRPTFFHFLLALSAVFAGCVLWWSDEALEGRERGA